MDAKKWYLSKGIWAGVIGIIVVLYNTLVTQLAAGCGVEGGLCVTLGAIPEWILGLLATFGLYGRATAKTTIQ